MNWLDIVIFLLVVFSVREGWRQGVVTQVLGLAALAFGLFLAWRYGGAIGLPRVVGFVVVLVVVIVAVVLLGRFTRGLFRLVGLGVFDNLLGVLFAVLKMMLFIGLFAMLFDVLDPSGRVVSPEVKEGSALFRAVGRVCDVVFPFIRNMFTVP